MVKRVRVPMAEAWAKADDFAQAKATAKAKAKAKAKGSVAGVVVSDNAASGSGGGSVPARLERWRHSSRYKGSVAGPMRASLWRQGLLQPATPPSSPVALPETPSTVSIVDCDIQESDPFNQRAHCGFSDPRHRTKPLQSQSKTPPAAQEQDSE